MGANEAKNKRIVLVHWKKQNSTEVFSNLKNFCLSYPAYSYNTLNNYLGKGRIPYENETIRIERKEILSSPKPAVYSSDKRDLIPVLRKVRMKEADDDTRDLNYWLSQPVVKRVEAATFLVSQMLKKGQRMDKTVVNKIKLKS